ncbi:efflux RND transporter permease subunit [Paracholeplasma manati]|uniref:efflux RND transporter permease subunit n=1 Tax=Paracholeplasma manati TaxID=591373 RepID=UPI002407E405|nr:MMPL family transporter [Paracholeplasma manati]MDG0888305.1 MMPL family transporter [Paracholeplasma manati]
MNKDHALVKTLKKTVPAVMTAMTSTALGLLSLYGSKVPMINDFGSMLTIGIVFAFIIGVLIFLPFLYIRDKHFPSPVDFKRKKSSHHNPFVSKLARVSIQFKYIILALSVVLAGIGIYFDLNATAETNLENFMPQDSEALADIKTLRNIIGSTEQIAIIIKDDNVLDEQHLALIQDIELLLTTNYQQSIIETQSLLTLLNYAGINNYEVDLNEAVSNLPEDQVKLFLNTNRTMMVINLSLKDMSDEVFDAFLTDLSNDIDYMNSTQSISITGQSVIDAEMMKALTTGRYQMTIIGLSLIFVTLLIIYKSFYRAILPILPVILIVGWSGLVMYLFGIAYTPLTATLGALIMGIGTEFTVLIIERYEEEKQLGLPKNEAIQSALSKMANPILVSSLTTMGGFSALILSDFVILSNFGIMTLVNLSLALLSTFIVLPTIMTAMLIEEKVREVDMVT